MASLFHGAYNLIYWGTIPRAPVVERSRFVLFGFVYFTVSRFMIPKQLLALQFFDFRISFSVQTSVSLSQSSLYVIFVSRAKQRYTYRSPEGEVNTLQRRRRF